METPRFCCDAMLGGLARWLRLAGYDATTPAVADDAVLAAVARREGRWLLTRDRRLAARAGPRVLCVRATAVAEQLREVGVRLRLAPDPARFFSRCSRCNGTLEPLDRGCAAALVPPFVATHTRAFSRCPNCGQVYWPGTHHGRILARLRESLRGGEDGGET